MLDQCSELTEDGLAMAEASKVRYVAAVDVGTTTIRCHVYDKDAHIVGHSKRLAKLVTPRPGWVEIDPDDLWNTFVDVVREAIRGIDSKTSQVACIGISTLRATFMTWDRDSGKHFHNFIVWNDLRADQLVRSWNSSLSMKCLRGGAKFLHTITGRRRYLAASVLTLLNKQVIMRLVWALDNVAGLRQRANEGKVMFGTIDTWLLWKLTGGREHATDYSNASSTALYDPFQLEWGTWAFKLFSIPPNMMPQVKCTSGYFGSCSREIFGSEIPIMALVGDQQAATFGQCCFDVGDVKCTMGTGSFVNVNTGSSPHASVAGLYPLVGWKLDGAADVVYLAEGSSNDTGTAVNWMQSVGLLNDPSESYELVQSTSDSGGVFFVPGFNGLQAPINDDRACAGVIGIRPNTSRAQIARAVLESLAYRIKQLHQVMSDEIHFQLSYMRIDGGVSANDFIVQEIADLTGKPIDRPQEKEMACLGAAFFAGLAAGVWKSQDELKALRKADCVFKPRTLTQKQRDSFIGWQKAVQRFLSWYV